MGNAARKERKRNRRLTIDLIESGWMQTPLPPFQHPAKVGTPFGDRAISQYRDDDGSVRSSRRHLKKLLGYMEASAYLPTGPFHQEVDGSINKFEYIEEAKRIEQGHPSLIAGNAAPEQGVERLPLDPKPYRIGRKRYAIGEEVGAAEYDMIFSPRKQYDQEADSYGL